MSTITPKVISPVSPDAPPLLGLPDVAPPVKTTAPASDLFNLYERVVETQPGTRDAAIFEKIRQWTFSDFSMPAYAFAGISKAELDAWQQRNRINLSAGQIRPDPIDLQRGYAWGQMRMLAHVNHLHSDRPPPSVSELLQMSSTR
jgi:hypothetical protein